MDERKGRSSLPFYPDFTLEEHGETGVEGNGLTHVRTSSIRSAETRGIKTFGSVASLITGRKPIQIKQTIHDANFLLGITCIPDINGFHNEARGTNSPCLTMCYFVLCT